MSLEEPADRTPKCRVCHGVSETGSRHFPLDPKAPPVWIYLGTCQKCVARDTEDRRRKRHDRELRKTYGITLRQRDGMLRKQGGKCKACGGDISFGDFHSRPRSTVAVIDHCHTTGRVRAILCFSCNTSLGHMRERPEAIRALADYAESHAV